MAAAVKQQVGANLQLELQTTGERIKIMQQQLTLVDEKVKGIVSQVLAQLHKREEALLTGMKQQQCCTGAAEWPTADRMLSPQSPGSVYQPVN